MLLAKKFNVPFVVDGDGLILVTTSIDLVNRYPLAVLTPNVDESIYKRPVQKVLNCEVDEQNAWPLCQTVNIIRLIRFILSGSGR
ncbi:unnamed protein product [Brassica oleracea var. botrytis]